uniref:NADH dehydrogenase subunit 4L n=2 Tax=Heterorhabditis TaxID=37861 RepID=A0A303_HETBA|nr:NADH dehydrogenase subunit 4L [Heterorhabditis indica]YP_817450.1 NADH dehydrogenase subunit 4L [Heterorhabditis bacteriophora]ABJ80694.1 NADH dehydrogenase subunit 4L [Heterorhabditis bacteriophora]AZU95935.1 NADH dehydrogenase subunit 4L [Heterorhabditis bacteriophora]QAA11080.1 NADH dehydrogenase subunit 4L [Heterorhabditis indica]QAA11092.1 NADH dehydrogenase subunit 4L [Heterorhabditis bacteriophora]
MIIFMFISLFMLFFKWQRLIFILISLEFIKLSLFLSFSGVISEMMFFYFMCFSVISSVLGMVVMVGNIKFYGDDNCVF